ncbi:spindle assembly abnormal protein 6 homolog isoform X1 [Trachemys scripta elegans]|uniref:spindle assembly abnormal protein 6 homolog isoform X1 n=1 Tax=Trachemys scripta elegans TaxID=31138 RepID=UPI001551EB36|nr:spindle assembly abnormal protein 6 homolog isoform X1 [Trachemys scripta elegans]
MAEQLFCKGVSAVISCAGCEERRADIRLTVETFTSSSPIHKKELSVRITDDADPLFLYSVAIGEEDFQSLKSQQGLLVDFSAFPQKFIDLLEQCILEQGKQVPRFLIQLVTSSPALDCMPACLNVVETNPFKHLTHLSLKLLAGSDSDIKKYLAVCIKNLKMENSMLEDKLHRSEEGLSKRLTVTQQALAEKSKELDKLQNEWTSQTTSLTNKYSREITAEKEKVLRIQAQYQLQHEQQKKEMEATCNRKVHHLETRVSEFETVNKDLTEKKYKSESSIRELKSKFAGLEEEYQRAKQEVLSLRRENSTLDTECHEKEKLLNQLRTRIAVLEQEVKDKEQVVIRSTDVCESAQEHKVFLASATSGLFLHLPASMTVVMKKLEESLEMKQLQIGKFESTVKSISEELLKANEIIKKLQGEMKKLMEKMKLKNAVTLQQEKILGEKEQTLQKERLELLNVKQALQQKEEEVFKLQEQLDITVQKLEESKQLLKTNENVISWLNKQLNENKIASMHGASGHSDMPCAGSATNSAALQNGLPRFLLYNSPFSVPVMPPPISTASLSNNYKGSVPLRMSIPCADTSAARYNPQVRINLSANSTSTPLHETRPCPPTSTPLVPPNSGHVEPPGLDMKYLKKDGNLPLRGLKPLSVASTVLSRTMLPKQGTPPVISAYFPGQQTRLPAS